MKILRNIFIPALLLFLPVIFAYQCEYDNLLLISTSDCVISRFDPDKTECTAPCTVSFENTSINAISSQWEFNGESSTDRDPIHTFAEPGSYSVRLITWRYHKDKLCIDTTEQFITVK